MYILKKIYIKNIHISILMIKLLGLWLNENIKILDG